MSAPTAVARRESPPDLIELPRNDPAALMEKVLVHGDLSGLSREQLAQYVVTVCQSLGLNPLTKPFEVLELDKRLVLYPNRHATDQLANLYGVTREIVTREVQGDLYVVVVRGTDRRGRVEEALAAVPLVKEGGSWQQTSTGKSFFKADGTVHPLSPQDRANVMMKCETKAKRRLVLSLIGLPLLDDREFAEAHLNAAARIDLLPAAPPAAPAVPALGPAADHTQRVPDSPPDDTRRVSPEPGPAEASRIDGLRKAHALAASLFPEEDDKHAALHDLAAAVWGVGSLADLRPGQLATLIRWLDDRQEDPLGSQILLEKMRALDAADSTAEVARLWRAMRQDGIDDDLVGQVAARRARGTTDA